MAFPIPESRSTIDGLFHPRITIHDRRPFPPPNHDPRSTAFPIPESRSTIHGFPDPRSTNHDPRIFRSPSHDPRSTGFPIPESRSTIDGLFHPHRARLDMDHLLQEARRLKGSFYEIGDVLENDIDIRNHTPSISPVPHTDSWISSRFGRRRDPFTAALHMHRGVDICNRIGTPVIATADGKVSVRRKDGNFGNYILIDHKYGLESGYAHLQRFSVRPGDRVKRGQIIGYLGRTGRVTAPHLHYGIKRDGRWVNPFPYFLEGREPGPNSFAAKIR